MIAQLPRGAAFLAGQAFALAAAASGQLVEHRIPKHVETIRFEMGMLHGIGSYENEQCVPTSALPPFQVYNQAARSFNFSILIFSSIHRPV